MSRFICSILALISSSEHGQNFSLALTKDAVKIKQIKKNILTNIFSEHGPDYFIMYGPSGDGNTMPLFVYDKTSKTSISDEELNNFKVRTVFGDGRVSFRIDTQPQIFDIFDYTIKNLEILFNNQNKLAAPPKSASTPRSTSSGV